MRKIILILMCVYRKCYEKHFKKFKNFGFVGSVHQSPQTGDDVERSLFNPKNVGVSGFRSNLSKQ